MNRQELYALHKELCVDAFNLMGVKNRDYGENDDPFRNFRRWGLLGILVRLGDKLSRLETFVDRGKLEVVDEQVRDAVLDIINYAVLFEGYNADGKGSSTGNQAGEIAPWTVPPRHDKELRAFVRRSWGSGTGGGGDHTLAPAQREAAHAPERPARRTGAMRGGDKHVGRKSGRGKGTR